MLRFLHSIFAAHPERKGRYDDELIKAATERVVDGTDPRLRSLPGYESRLADAVECAVDYIMGLVDALPAPLDMEAEHYGRDPYLRAFFASRNDLERTVASSRTLTDFVRDHRGPLPQTIVAGFGVEYEERRVLGIAMRGEVMERDVAQTAINFHGHRLVTPTDSEADTRWEVKKRGFDSLIAIALHGLVSSKTRSSDLRRQRDLLLQKLKVLEKGQFSLHSELARETDDNPEIADLEQQLSDIEVELLKHHSASQTLDDSLNAIADVLAHPDKHLWVTPLELRMNQMGLKLDPGSTEEPALDLHLQQVESSTGVRRCFMLVQVRPPKPRDTGDFLEEASRYLG